jgi:hypothetical protein
MPDLIRHPATFALYDLIIQITPILPSIYAASILKQSHWIPAQLTAGMTAIDFTNLCLGNMAA